MNKKKIFILVIAVFLIALCIVFLINRYTLSLNNKLASDSESSEYQDAVAAYDSFLNGTTNAQDPKQEISDGFVDIAAVSLEPDLTTYYALFDMNEDGIPELHLRPAVDGSYLIFTYTDGKIVLWYDGTDYETPLNNGAILYERDGGAPTHINYSYFVLDKDGNQVSEVDFSKYHSVDQTTYEESDEYDQFMVGNKEVKEDEWNLLTQKYLSEPSDLIQWKEVAY